MENLLSILIVIVIAVGFTVANLLILRANQKMYTEYFKDRSILARSKDR